MVLLPNGNARPELEPPRQVDLSIISEKPASGDMQMKRTTCLAMLLCLSVGSMAAGTGTDFADRVGTLPLDTELDARGNLGGVTVDRLGFIYVANFRDGVWRISPEGAVTELSRSLYGSSGNAIDSRGDLYQASFFGNTITRISRSGDERHFATEGLDGPVGLAFGADGALYVCNCSGNYLSRVTADGEVTEFARSDRFACPNGIAVADDGDLYVTNFNNRDILRIRSDGSVTGFATVPGGAGNAHIAFSKGFFYVTRIISNSVVKVSRDGEVLPVAGTGAAGHADGSGPEATLAHPNGIAISPAGDRLYVNTMIGDYTQPRPSRMTVRTIDLVTLTRVLDKALADGGMEAAAAAYMRYKADPVRGQEDTVAEMTSYGYLHLSSGRIAEALAFFRLNAESYPQVAAAQYQLGEAYRYTGQNDAAIAQYNKALELDAEHEAARSRLVQLGAGLPESAKADPASGPPGV
jgi:DNA-binding beta-propeller fold protein YncE